MSFKLVRDTLKAYKARTGKDPYGFVVSPTLCTAIFNDPEFLPIDSKVDKEKLIGAGNIAGYHVFCSDDVDGIIVLNK